MPFSAALDPDFADILLRALLASPDALSKAELQKLRNSLARDRGIARVPTDDALLSRYRELVTLGELPMDRRVVATLRRRGVRSLSGITVISLLAKPWACPGKCTYCPTYVRLPKSYVPGEPAVMRAERNGFDPMRQVRNRLAALDATGHVTGKCDVRIIGGTWSVYPSRYREDFVRDIYDAHTSYGTGDDAEIVRSADLEEAKTRNETAEHRVIGMAIETRPDWVTPEEIAILRRHGVTRVEIGYQTTIDSINELTKRGHGNAESIRATKFLKDAGFKVVAHMMPNLPGSSPELDRESFARVWDDPDFRPDELKLYPTVVSPESELASIWREGGYMPYDDATLIDLTADLVAMIPEYVRLNRLYRDIPASEIIAGSTLANLREHVERAMRERGTRPVDVSAREIRSRDRDPSRAVLHMSEYDASGGREFFLQWIDPDDRTLWSLLRLRIPSWHFEGGVAPFPEIAGCAIIREVHTFGDQLAVGEASNGTGQHMGFGKRLVARAEEIVRERYTSLTGVAAISGVGVRGYYAKLGYARAGEYMVKKFA